MFSQNLISFNWNPLIVRAVQHCNGHPQKVVDITGFYAEVGWPSVSDALVKILALQRVGLNDPWGPFQLYDSMFFHLFTFFFHN